METGHRGNVNWVRFLADLRFNSHQETEYFATYGNLLEKLILNRDLTSLFLLCTQMNFVEVRALSFLLTCKLN